MTASNAKPIITRLPDTLINQIAAGEVVERPASIVKELIENSLDAGATKIDVLLRDGGLSEIKVIDNGIGMGPEDLPLSLERHATSKITQFNDLQALESFGFRGEALASVASVAKVEIQSRMADADSAHVITADFGVISEPRPQAGPIGTAVTVFDLFSKLPARQKFLRSGQTEFAHSSKLVREMALANPGVTITLHHQGRVSASYSGQTAAARFQECFKVPWAPVEIREETEDMRLDAYLSPSDLLQDKGELFVFVNGRNVRNRNLALPVKQAYQEALGPHHDPSGAVYLEIRKDWVDVNVHPQKWEVRCLRQERVYQWILTSVRKQIAQLKEIRTLEVKPSPTPTLPMDSGDEIALPLVTTTFQQTSRYVAPPKASAPVAGEELRQEIIKTTQGLMGNMVAESRRYLGQIKASYLLIEENDGLILVDQHALHEKMVYEKLKRAFGEGTLQTQTFLVPKIISLTQDLYALMEGSLDLFQKMGFDIELFGNGDVAVKSCPILLKEERMEGVIRESLKSLMEHSRETAMTEVLNPVFATMACHSVVRAGQSLGSVEAETLLKGLGEIENGWTCPHGRPILFRLTYQSIQKYFERT